MQRIYLDNAATTSLAPAVLEAMLPYMTQTYGNPSSVHWFGREAHKAIDKARRQVAALLGADPTEVFFTGCGSESDNWAIKGAAFAGKNKGRHVITTQIEHHAVLHTCAWLEKQGFTVTYLPVDERGRVDPADVVKAVRPETVLISVMMANNEVGTIEPIREIADIAHEKGILFHTDAVQAAGAIPVNVHELGVDMLSVSAHKLHGPKGVGALYIRKGYRPDELIHGGAQERGYRAGTENVAAIVGFGAACELAAIKLEESAKRVSALRDRLAAGLCERIPAVRINGDPERKLPNNCSITIDGVEGEAVLLRLDLAGIAASSGSACTSGSLDPSHVLLAMGRTQTQANGTLRLTLGAETTGQEIDTVLEILPEIVADLRRMTGFCP